MRKNRRLSNSLLLGSFALQLLLTASCAQKDQTPANKSGENPKAADTKSTPPAEAETSAGTYDGVRITVLSIGRTKERDVLPGFPTGQKMVAKKGSEFALLELKVKTAEAGKKLDVKRLQLQDAKGNKYKCVYEATDLCDANVGEKKTCELPFNVPEGAVFAKLIFGESVIDLANVEKK